MKPDSIFLVRHGESVGNVDKTIYHTIPDWKIPLTPKGTGQARQAGSDLGCLIRELYSSRKFYLSDFKGKRELANIYTSPWYRARQTTAELVKGIGIPDKNVKEDPRLREQEWGNYQETHIQKKIKEERQKYGSFFYRMPNGESGANVYDRVTTFIDTLHRDFEDENFPYYTVISTHGLTIKAFLTRWFHWSVELFDSLETPDNCDIIRMELNGSYRYDLITPLKKYPE